MKSGSTNIREKTYHHKHKQRLAGGLFRCKLRHFSNFWFRQQCAANLSGRKCGVSVSLKDGVHFSWANLYPNPNPNPKKEQHGEQVSNGTVRNFIRVSGDSVSNHNFCNVGFMTSHGPHQSLWTSSTVRKTFNVANYMSPYVSNRMNYCHKRWE